MNMGANSAHVNIQSANRAVNPADAAGAIRWVLPIGVGIITAACFHRALYNQFVNIDDLIMLDQNESFRGLGLAQLRWMFTTFHTGPYQPLSWLTYAIDYCIWGMNPVGYHLTNLILHTATAVAFYFLSLRLLRLGFGDSSGAPYLNLGAAASAIVFAIHPLRVESVVWATERRDVLSGLFYVLTVLTYLRYVAADSAGAGRRWYFATTACFLACLLAKAMAVTLPVALLILDVYPLRRLGRSAGWIGAGVRRVWLEKIPLFLLSLGVGVIAILGQHVAGGLVDIERIPPIWRIGIAAYATCFYLVKMACPRGLAPMYEFGSPYGPWVPYMLAAFATIIMISAAAIVLRRRFPAIAAAWVFYLVTLAPVSGLIQAGMQVAADRYTYLPTLGFNILVGAIVALAARQVGRNESARRWPFAVVVSLVVAALAAATIRQSLFWHDSKRIAYRMVDVDPKCMFAIVSLGILHLADGEFEKALHYSAIGAAGRPKDSEPQFIYAKVLRQLGRESEASEYYRRAAMVGRPTAEALFEYGMILARKGDYSGAARYLSDAVAKQPSHAEASVAIGAMRAAEGKLDEAATYFTLALNSPQLTPTLALAIAASWKNVSRPQEAVAALRAGLTKHPDNTDLQLESAWLLATCPSDDLRDGKEAARLVEQTRNRAPELGPRRLLVLAAAQAELGQFDAARESISRATELASARKDTIVENLCRQWAPEIAAGRPIRDKRP